MVYKNLMKYVRLPKLFINDQLMNGAYNCEQKGPTCKGTSTKGRFNKSVNKLLQYSNVLHATTK